MEVQAEDSEVQAEDSEVQAEDSEVSISNRYFIFKIVKYILNFNLYAKYHVDLNCYA